MGKREKHKQDLTGLLDASLVTGEVQELLGYIVSNSNLPGPRGNLELAHAFADVVEAHSASAETKLWELCVQMTEVSVDEAPVNDPRELIPFCGAMGIGTIGSLSPALFEPALTTLRTLANDPRWRMREGVCFGLQRLLAGRRRDTLEALEAWVAAGALLEMRAAAAAVAEPALLKERETAISALTLHQGIIDQVLEATERKREAFRVLRKGLGYTVSVVVCALPEEGFAFMAQLVETRDPDVLWIVRQNLKKSRLVKGFPESVECIQGRLP